MTDLSRMLFDRHQRPTLLGVERARPASRAGWLLLCIAYIIGEVGCRSEGPVSHAEKTETITRIVSLSPNITEILFDLGVGPHVVAVTRFCDYPSQATTLPKIGGFIDPSFEAIISHRPDLVLGLSTAAAQGIASRLEGAAILTHLLPMDTLADTRSAIVMIAELVGERARGDAVAAELDKGLAQMADRIRGRAIRRVVVVVGHRPMVVVGPGTFIDELVTLAGGLNVAGKSTLAYPTWSKEAVAATLPDVIIDTSMGSETMTQVELLRQWSEWTNIPAVKHGRVVHLPDTAFLRPGPRLVYGLAQLSRAIHPEAFVND